MKQGNAIDETRLKILFLQGLEGNSASYERFLELLQQRLRPYLRKRVSQEEVVEDLLQEILMGVHRSRDSFRKKDELLAWVFAISRFKLADHLRSVYKRKDKEILVDEEFEYLRFSCEILDGVDLESRAKNILVHLPAQQQRVVELLKFEGKSIREVSQLLQLSESAVKINAHRAYKSMVKVINESSL